MIAVLALAFSFCSLGYQLVLALALSDATDDFVLSQALSLGVFLLGMGIGSWRCQSEAPKIWPRLLAIEWRLALLGLISGSYIHVCESGLKLLALEGALPLYILALPYAGLIGYWTGFELPLLLQADPRWKSGWILGANYLGAFAATVIVPIYFLPHLDVTGTAHVLGVVNFLAASSLLPRAGIQLRNTFVHLGTGLLVLSLVRLAPMISDLHLKMVYFAPRLSSEASLLGTWGILRNLEVPIRQRTAYQWIDLLPPEFSSAVQGHQDFQLYLDRKLQLSEGSLERYHESMVHGGMNLLGRTAKRVLILGGGDGLLAKDLLTYPEIETIDLVELDPSMIRLARQQRELKRLNGGSLDNSRVRLHETDAFQFVRRGTDKYDLILVDLPFPNNYDLCLLFTREFYALTRKRLTSDGVMLLDFPLPGGDQRNLPTLVHTLRAAGFERLFAFGTEDFFVAAAARPLAFDFDTLIPRVRNSTLTNLISRAEDLAAAGAVEAPVNSVMRPLRFGVLQ